MYDFLEALMIEVEVVHEKYRFASDFSVVKGSRTPHVRLLECA
jgi:hypothetical protein